MSSNSVGKNNFHMQLLFSPSSCPVLIILFKYTQLKIFEQIYTGKDVFQISQKKPALRNLVGID